uniref:General transcription factor IIIC, polypeptide 3 n=1 Tax=Gadus morhua TaxID=8049 RepID=A0A8C4ZKA9_GADMO
MSGFSAELIDYLEGRITFEEFDRRREEREAAVSGPGSSRGGGGGGGGGGDGGDGGGGDGRESPSVGDIFALEMELNRENSKMMRERRHRSKLPRALRGLMGEANIRYARGEKDDAIVMCMEIIRQAPLAYEPFSTLAMIYEDDGDVDKALQFGLIAAHLNPSDCEEWVKLADMSLDRDNVRQAIICYSKAVKYDPTNVRYLWERSGLYMRLGEHKQCMDGYRRILSLLPREEGEHFMTLSKDMAKSYFESDDLPSALGVTEEALLRHPELVTDDMINMAAELYLAGHQHSKALQVDTHTHTHTHIVEVEVPDSVPVDIRAKLMVCLIHQHVYTPLDGLLTEMMGQSPEEVGDLHLDVAEAFLEEGEFSSALQLLSALVTSVKYNLAVVWLRHAECLKALGHLEAAAESYDRVVEMAPQHLGARLSLSTLQQQLGRPESALKALEPMYDPDTLAQDSSATQKELKLLLHRSTLLKTQGHLQDYIDAVITMISLLLKVAMTRSCVCVRSVMVAGKRHRRLVKVKDMTTDDVTDQEAAYQDISGECVCTSVLSREEWWQLLVDCVHTMCEVGRYQEAELMVDSAMEFYSFYENKPKRKQLEFFGLSAAFLDHNYRKAYDYIRIMLMDTSDAERPQLWNVFNQVTLNSQHQRHHRFCLRLMLKNPDNHALCVLCGHNAMVSGSFKHALGQYMQAFRTHGSNPMYSLCVGLTFFHLAAQKFVSKRHPLVLQGFSFLWRYVELRGECQESLYNLGRALHQMGLVHLAIHYYHQALALPPPALEGIEADQVDLRREIAFNLSLIYQASGNTHLARQTLYTHCVI